jgi:hypothetical protein
MMRLKAICVGYAVPFRGFKADVHSTFASAANLRLFKKGSHLLTLVTVEEGDLPQGIRVNSPPGFSFEELHAGENIICRDGILSSEHNQLTIDLRPARRWKCDLSALATDINDSSVSAAWRSVKRTLDGHRARAGTGSSVGQVAIADRMDKNISDLVAATRQYDLSAVAAVASLIGLGSGLTPAGDDFLVGYLAGLWCSAHKGTKRFQFLSSLRKAVIRLSKRTNDISRTYLNHAARGQVSSRLTNLAEAICQGKRPERLLELAEAAIQIGHLSGMEAVAGLLLGLSAWNVGLA